MNVVTITGRLVKDPEAHTTQGGITRSTFDVAVRRAYKNADGQYDADFLPVVAWRAQADFANKYMRKGSLVSVSGNVQRRSYPAQDGSKRYVTEIIAERVEIISNPTAKADTDGFTETDEKLPWDE